MYKQTCSLPHERRRLHRCVCRTRWEHCLYSYIGAWSVRRPIRTFAYDWERTSPAKISSRSLEVEWRLRFILPTPSCSFAGRSASLKSSALSRCSTVVRAPFLEAQSFFFRLHYASRMWDRGSSAGNCTSDQETQTTMRLDLFLRCKVHRKQRQAILLRSLQQNNHCWLINAKLGALVFDSGLRISQWPI